MKDIIEFPVVGTRFSEGGFLMARLLDEGDVLRLEHEPDNQHDSNAVKVIAFDEEHIGYVPNKGVSCDLCFTHIKPSDQYCPCCGASWEHFVQGGLAMRLIKSGVLKRPFACYAKVVNKSSEDIVVTAKIITE